MRLYNVCKFSDSMDAGGRMCGAFKSFELGYLLLNF